MLYTGLYIALFAALCARMLLSDPVELPRITDPEQMALALLPLRDVCVERQLDSWGQIVCFGRAVMFVQYDALSGKVSMTNTFDYHHDLSVPDHLLFQQIKRSESVSDDCAEGKRVNVFIECCPLNGASAAAQKSRLFRLPSSDVANISLDIASIRSVDELDACSAAIRVCSSLVCAQPRYAADSPAATPPPRSLAHPYLRPEVQSRMRSRVQEMFVHAYDSYMSNAFPHGELRPIECSGGQFEPIKLPAVTLIDTLDTLVIMGNHSEFRHAVSMVLQTLPTFDIDENVSVFETTIRLLGGLLSAHLLAVDPRRAIFAEGEYQDELLLLARDLGDRLLPAFNTKTGIPYGTVNLRHGVPKGETKIASTAGAGSLLLEFQALSLLTGEGKYGQAALRALEGLYERRSPLHLVGKHIHVDTGQWLETTSGVGSNSDSFYEYILKALSLEFSSEGEDEGANAARRDKLWEMFLNTYAGIKEHVLHEDRWFSDVDMFTGAVQRKRMEALDAFWPGVEASMGMFTSSSRQLNAFFDIARDLSFVPEEVDWGAYTEANSDRDRGANLAYFLRPEVAESTYFHYRATRDRSWLFAGKQLLDSLDNLTRTGCGFASVAHLRSLELNDNMPSYFLAETLKYLFLLFDEDHFVHDGAYVFTTEAHPLDLQLLHDIAARRRASAMEPTARSRQLSPAPPSPPPRTEPERPANLSSPPPQQCPVVRFLSLPQRYTHVYTHPSVYRVGSTSGVPAQVRPAGSAALEGGVQSARELRHRAHTIRARTWLAAHPVHRAKFASAAEPKCSVHEMGPQIAAAGRPKAVEASTAPRASRSTATGVLKQTTVNMGMLGDFQVSVFADGFSIEARGEQNTLDVIQAGEGEALVRESDSLGSRLVMGTKRARSVACEVLLVSRDSAGALWRRDCSIGAFGPPPPFSAQAPLHLSHVEETWCDTTAAATATAVASAGAQLHTKAPWWWSGASRVLQRVGSLAFAQGPAGGGGAGAAPRAADVGGAVVVARRGECLFENKAQTAERAGASAVIVRNNEDALFVMAGKHGAEQTGVAQAQVDPDPVRIPAVMLMQSDAESLEATARALSADVLVSVTATHDVLQTSDLMGNGRYPKVFTARRVVYVLTARGWGAYFKSQQGDDWQMYLMDKRDVATHRLLPPTTVLSAQGRRISTSAHLLLPPQRVYAHIVQRKCPRMLRVDDDGATVRLLPLR